VEECREECDEGVNVQPLERHKSDMSPASAKEADDRVSTTAVFCEPTFTDNGAQTGTKTGEEAVKPEAIDHDRGIGGFVRDGWVRHVRQLWVAAIQ